MKWGIIAASAAALAVASCATVIKGSSQDIVVGTEPAGADCMITRQGNLIGRVNPTPGKANIEKTKYDIKVVCTKSGFEDASYDGHSGIEGATFGNFALGGLIGWGMDSALGSDNHYDSPINITLKPRASSGEAGAVSSTH